VVTFERAVAGLSTTTSIPMSGGQGPSALPAMTSYIYAYSN